MTEFNIWSLTELLNKIKTDYKERFFEHVKIMNNVWDIDINDYSLGFTLEFNGDVVYYFEEIEGYDYNQAEISIEKLILPQKEWDKYLQDLRKSMEIETYKNSIRRYEYNLENAKKNIDEMKKVMRESKDKIQEYQLLLYKLEHYGQNQS